MCIRDRTDVQLSKKQTDKFRRLFMDLYLQSSLWQLGGWTAVSLFYSGAAYGPERRPTSEKVRKATPPDADKLVELRGRLGPDSVSYTHLAAAPV